MTTVKRGMVPYTREDVLKATKNLTGETVPVHVQIDVTQVVLAQPEMRELLAAAETIAVGRCVCRETERNCDLPLDVCLSLDAEARRKIKDRAWREISLDDALLLLEETHRLGLVHIAYRRGDGDISFVCSCCTCCCWPLTGLRQFDYRDGIAESAYVARFDQGKCIGCGVCVERCPFGVFVRHKNSECIAHDEDRCFGCGLCVSTCPSGAIRFVKREG